MDLIPWPRLRPLLAEHGILEADVDGPMILDERMIAVVRASLEAHPSPPVEPEVAVRSMRAFLRELRHGR